MAITAPNIAFAHLFNDRSKTEPVSHQLHHCVSFVRAGTMIEVEESEVGGAAVDAGMGQQMVGDKRDACGSLRICARTNHRDVMLTIALVIPPGGSSIAVSTHFLMPVWA